MRRLLMSVGAVTLFFSGSVAAVPYALSPDGLAVVRIEPTSLIVANTFNSSLLPSGYTSSTTSGGSLEVAQYTAGWDGGGGGEIGALFTPPASLSPSKTLEWVQVGINNAPIPGYPSPFLDSNPASLPFYAGLHGTLPSGQSAFYDFSIRSSSTLSTVDPVVWNANLYPAAVDASNHIEIYDGISWGWTMTKAPVGTTSATFTNPTPAGATVSGVGTSNFSWGAGSDPSWLSFVGTAFDTIPGTLFKIGTLTYYNGAINSGSGASSVVFEVPISFTNVPELDFTFETTFTLINTPNTGGPLSNADIVSIGAFGHSFHVLEGAMASVDLMAILSTSLTGTPGGSMASNYTEWKHGPFDPSPSFVITGLSFANPGSGGFISQVPKPSQVPEPSTWILLAAGLPLIPLARRRVGHDSGFALMKILSLVSFILLTAFLPSQSLAADHLLFKQAGPTNWSIPPFSIAIGVADETTWQTIYVTEKTYKSVRALITKSGSPSTNWEEMVFAVTEFNGELPLPTVFVPDEVVVQVMGDISSTYKAHHQTIHPLISHIMRSFPRPK
ncbi:hypothetical protein AGMMS50225_18830 [Betaproteobacteria bacterium]|nr:hypothetical protein AGMMS50225_18830 [Betaproteobacteria bacterium]